MPKQEDRPTLYLGQPGTSRKLAVVSLVIILTVTYGLFFYLQGITENQIKDSIFEQRKNIQIEASKAVSQHVESDLRGIVANLGLLSHNPDIQDGDLSGQTTKAAAESLLMQINRDLGTVAGQEEVVIDSVFIADADYVISTHVRPEGLRTFVGSDLSEREFAHLARETESPIISNGFMGFEGPYRIAVTYPIIDSQTAEYVGLVGVSMPTERFFQYYGNIYDIESQYLAVLDTNTVQLAHPAKDLVGKRFFEDYTQEATGRNAALNDLIRTVMSGASATAVYEFRNGERLNTGSVVYYNDVPHYFIFIITPTSSIYAQVDDVLFLQRIETFTLLAGISAAAVILILFLMRWNSSLDRAVKERTVQMQESNEQLALANERLVSNDKMQKEFINIAAHELRTPIQPIISLSEVLRSKISDSDSKKLLDAINRSGQRLERLSSDILDVTRIESQTLKLSPLRLRLDEVLRQVVEDARLYVAQNSKKVQIIFEESKDQPEVNVDRNRIHQVVLNLLDNAIKFTETGSITVSSFVSENGGKKVTVAIRDTGAGIHPEIIPRLFEKFATKSETGTGLGLYLSKSIVEAHGGKIWAENNEDGRGATFYFNLPAI